MDSSLNILILSCGTRNLLVRYFKEKGNGFGKVIGTDCSIYAPALYEADAHYIVPRMTDPGYLDMILDICRKESVHAVLPLQEDELFLIASHRKIFEDVGVIPVVSAQDSVNLCRDKYAFYQYLKQHDLPAITSCNSFEAFVQEAEAGHMKLPVFIKPTHGCGSIGIQKVTHFGLLEALCKCQDEQEDSYLIQNYADGEEFGADIYVDLLTKKPVSIFVKKKLRMRAGETEKSVSYHDGKLFELIEQTIGPLNLAGPIDMDIFCIDGNYYISEINPRFGGGYPHAYNCGINFPQMIAKNISGETNTRNIGSYEDGVVMLKYSELTIRKSLRDYL
ncbi:MAG: ATP-grasp domain-containing protein [Eubacterium sp.]|nr:ATP-grasp domain-containing protein [Eubacterium sp.]